MRTTLERMRAFVAAALGKERVARARELMRAVAANNKLNVYAFLCVPKRDEARCVCYNAYILSIVRLLVWVHILLCCMGRRATIAADRESEGWEEGVNECECACAL